MLDAVARYFSYAFHGLLALFLIGASSLALSSNPGSLSLDMVPWVKGTTLTYSVFIGGIFGLLSVLLAIKRTLPVLLFVWAVLVAVLLIKGYIFSGYGFSQGEFTQAVILIVCSLIAIAGPWRQMRRRPEPVGKGLSHSA